MWWSFPRKRNAALAGWFEEELELQDAMIFDREDDQAGGRHDFEVSELEFSGADWG